MLSDDVFTELTRLRAAGSPFCLATVVRVEAPTSGKPGDKAIIAADGSMVGWIGGSCSEPSIRREALLALSDGSPRLVRIAPTSDSLPDQRAGEILLGTSCPSGGTIEIFLEPQLARPQLMVIGRSPVAKTLIRLSALIGFRTCAVHPGGAAQDFPEADRVVPSLEAAAGEIGPDSWVVVATMGHYDEEALEAVLGVQSVAYVGLIASRRRRNAIVQVLRQHGWTGDALAGIVNPAGRMLGDTQEEIALSVMADIVARRHRRQKRQLPNPLTEASTVEEGVTATDSLFATDPICGMAVEMTGALYRSGDVYFCSPGCRDAFAASTTHEQAHP